MPLGVTALVVGGGGLIVGAIAGAMSWSQTSTIKSQCSSGACPPTLNDGSDTQAALGNARTLATVSNVAFIAGGVVAAAGLAFVIVAATKQPHRTMALHFGPGSITLDGLF